MSEEKKIPKMIFIVPYRNRIQHKFFFSRQMNFLLEERNDYEIYFSHQCDARSFNRGAIKNIGFLAVKQKYPKDYKKMTFVFNDIDTLPFHKLFQYETIKGIVKHFYGYRHALGGIVSITGEDFETINGYPCYWGWGMEDNALQKRCERFHLKIDRSHFYEIGSPEMLQLFDGISRIISKSDPWRSEYDSGTNGLVTIFNLKYTIDKKSDNPNDNVYVMENERYFYINIKTFLTESIYEKDEYFNYDLREPRRKIIAPHLLKKSTHHVSSTKDWSNIPFFPTTKEKREQTMKYLIQNKMQIPNHLIKQIQKDKMDELRNDVYNKGIVKSISYNEEKIYSVHPAAHINQIKK
jgi:hypothetical protein